MSTNNVFLNNETGLLDKALIASIVDVWFDKALSDYRINRYFYPRPVEIPTEALKAFLYAALDSKKHEPEELSDLLNVFFMAAFARGNTQPSLVTGRDFAFLLDIIGGQEIRTITFLCDAHSHFMRLEPHDDVYDVVMDILTATLQDLGITGEQATGILALAEQARDPMMGRGEEILKAA
jgi:hypothetical protein